MYDAEKDSGTEQRFLVQIGRRIWGGGIVNVKFDCVCECEASELVRRGEWKSRTSLPTAVDRRAMVQLKARYGYGGSPKAAMAETLKQLWRKP